MYYEQWSKLSCYHSLLNQIFHRRLIPEVFWIFYMIKAIEWEWIIYKIYDESINVIEWEWLFYKIHNERIKVIEWLCIPTCISFLWKHWRFVTSLGFPIDNSVHLQECLHNLRLENKPWLYDNLIEILINSWTSISRTRIIRSLRNSKWLFE